MTEESMIAVQTGFDPGFTGWQLEIRPIGEVDAGLLAQLTSVLAELFGFSAAVGAALPLPPHSFDIWRRQHRSAVFLSALAAVRSGEPLERYKFLGVTGADLFVPGLNFVFGEARRAQGVAVISQARLKPELEGGSADDALLKQRLLKEAVHELGHVFGLGHCDNPHCIMHFSRSIGDTDRKGPGFCPACLEQLQLKRGSA